MPSQKPSRTRSPRPSSSQSSKPHKRRLSKRQRQIYRRRRIAVVLGVVVFVGLSIFCIYSLIRGAVDMHAWINVDDRVAISRTTEPPTPVKKSKVQDCTANDIDLDLVPSATTVAVGGSVEFTAKITYKGSNPAGCYVDGSDDSRVLQISSGNDVIWRSDACDVTSRPLLMLSGVTDEQKIVWNTNRTGSSCVADGELPHVEQGTYIAQLVLKDNAKIASQPVTITVA